MSLWSRHMKKKKDYENLTEEQKLKRKESHKKYYQEHKTQLKSNTSQYAKEIKAINIEMGRCSRCSGERENIKFKTCHECRMEARGYNLKYMRKKNANTK